MICFFSLNICAYFLLLGFGFRYTDRRKSAIHHFKQALSLDPLMWTAYEELCVLGLQMNGLKFF